MGRAYKLMRVKKNHPGQLFPLFVLSDEPLPMHVYLTAKEGPKDSDGKVKSRLGPLAFRPGFHLSEVPLATHIGAAEDGVIKYMHPDTVWCECTYPEDINYQEEADLAGTVNGKVIKQKACLKHVPVDGFYHFKTSPLMFGDWIISGGMEIERILTDEDVAVILKPLGLTPQPRKEPIDLFSYGFKK